MRTGAARFVNTTLIEQLADNGFRAVHKIGLVFVERDGQSMVRYAFRSLYYSWSCRDAKYVHKPYLYNRVNVLLREEKVEIALIKSYSEKPWRSPETYQLIEDSLREKWHVRSISTEDPGVLHSMLTAMRRETGDSIFAFNVAEHLDEKQHVGFLPALLEEWQIPHLASSCETVAIGLDKARTKQLLQDNGIPTPKYFVVKNGDSDIEEDADRIGYPLFVKPIGEGGHIGIDEDSIIHDDVGLDKAVKRILDEHEQPALVEEYINGESMREFSVGIVESETRLLTPIEIAYESMDGEPILSYEAAQNDQEKTKLVQGEVIRDEIIDLSERTFAAVGARDYSRVDLRMNQSGCYVLEINVMPGLGPDSFLPRAAKDIYGLEYGPLVQKLVEVSMERQGVEW
jgi:D-alanine-D-alanine ligase